MGGADDRRPVLRQESVRRPVERVPGVHAIVLVGIDFVTPPDNESHERPLPVAYRKLPAAWVVQIRKGTDFDFFHCRGLGV